MSDLGFLQELPVSATEKQLSLSDSEKELMRDYAEKVFGSRCGVLQQPGPDPKEDRYLAMLRLLRIAARYGGKRVVSLCQSHPFPGWFYYCTDVWEHTCYDGGCYSDDSDYYGVELFLVPDLQPVPSWLSKRDMIKLEKPLGLSDSVFLELHNE